MSKISDMIISALMKRGILGEAKNISSDIEIPDSNIKIHVKIENVTVRIEKLDKNEDVFILGEGSQKKHGV